VGEDAELRLSFPINGRRKFKGTIQNVDNGQIELLVDGEVHEINVQQVEKAQLIAKY
jgi:ribosome maturation factor RimP